MARVEVNGKQQRIEMEKTYHVPVVAAPESQSLGGDSHGFHQEVGEYKVKTIES